MTLATTDTRFVSMGDASSTHFPFAVKFLAPDHVGVQVWDTVAGDSVLSVLNGSQPYDYTLDGAYDAEAGEYLDGADVVFNTAPPATYRITRFRNVPLTQLLDLVDNFKFPASSVNAEHDKLTMIDQQQQDQIDRAVKAPEQDPVGLNMTLPAQAVRANQGMAFDNAGRPIAGMLSSVPVSAAMQAVFQANTLSDARDALGLGAMAVLDAALGDTLASHTLDYSVTLSDANHIIPAAGYISLTWPAASTFPNGTLFMVMNLGGSRAVKMGIAGRPWLFPGQNALIFVHNGAYYELGPDRWRPVQGTEVFADPSGHDTTNDGLALAAPLKLIPTAWDFLQYQTDYLSPVLKLTPGVQYPPAGELVGDRGHGFGRVISIQGDPTGANPAQIIGAGSDICIGFRDGGWGGLIGIEVGSTGTGTLGIAVSQDGLADCSKVLYGSMVDGTHLSVADDGLANITGDEYMGGNCGVHWDIRGNGKLVVGSVILDGGGVTYGASIAFALCDDGGHIAIQTPTIQNYGLYGGVRYALTAYGRIKSNGYTLPGSASGTEDAYSHYF